MRRSSAPRSSHALRVYGSAALLVALLLGCTGTIAGADGERAAAPDSDRAGPRDSPADGAPGEDRDPVPDDGAAGAGGDSDDAPLDCATAEVDPGPSPMRLLTRTQYLNTVRDLFGEIAGVSEALGPATEASAFGLVPPDITQVEIESFQAAADRIAAAVAASPELLERVAPCDPSAAPADCARAMITGFGARAYRAPIDDGADIDRHLALFQAGAQTSYAHGIELVLRGMLQAPRFLYRVEVGAGEQVGARAIALSSHELAARLSYLVWNTLPDAALTAAAEDGSLQTTEGLRAALARAQGDARGATLVRRFLEGWVHLPDVARAVKDEQMFPEWQEPALRTALQDQARAFFDHVLGSEGGRLPALLTSKTVFVRADLGDYYGVAGGDEFEPLELEGDRASGLLTLPALLALMAKPDESSPIYRGKFVREALLCQQLPAPPANVPKPPEVEPDVSTRERLSQHEVDPACSNCHRMLDPIGFGFEHFDALGRYRESDGGRDVDASGELIATRDADGEFEGVAELGDKLAGSAEVQECVARQFFRYALGRFEQEDLDACSMQALLQAFAAADQDLNTLPAAVIETAAFRYRRPVDAEVSP